MDVAAWLRGVPDLRSVAILSNPANPNHALLTRHVEVAAQGLGLHVRVIQARGPHEFDGAFTAMAEQGADALIDVGDALFGFHAARLAELAVKNRLPSMHQRRAPVQTGGLMSYGPDVVDFWRSAPTFIDKLLKGAKPSDLPV